MATTTLTKARKSFLIDSLLEEKQRQLQHGEEEDIQSTSTRPDDDDDRVEPDTESAQSSPIEPHNHPGGVNLLSAFTKLVGGSAPGVIMTPADYAARFRMMPNFAALAQAQIAAAVAASKPGAFAPHPFFRPEGQIPLMPPAAALNRLLTPQAFAAVAAQHQHHQHQQHARFIGMSATSSTSTTTTSSVGSASSSVRSSNVKKYRCDVCDKTFSRSNTLITHKRIHTGEKPFRCEHCGRAFRQPGNLTRHRLTHTTEKPFVCAECGKAFNRASNLHTHMRTHMQGSKLQCGFCSKTFMLKTELRSHFCAGSSLAGATAAAASAPSIGERFIYV